MRRRSNIYLPRGHHNGGRVWVIADLKASPRWALSVLRGEKKIPLFIWTFHSASISREIWSNITLLCTERNIVFELKPDSPLLLLLLTALWPSVVFQDAFPLPPLHSTDVAPPHPPDMKKTRGILVSDLFAVSSVSAPSLLLWQELCGAFQEVAFNPISSRGTRTRCVFTSVCSPDHSSPVPLNSQSRRLPLPPSLSGALQMCSGRAVSLLALSTAGINF